MTKKKELTLQDILNQMEKDFKLLSERFTTIEEKLTQITGNNSENSTQNSTNDIPNTAYVTLTEDGCFVGGEPATQYNGEDIYRPYLCVAYFKEARGTIRLEHGYELLELHCLQSSTAGKYAETGNPVPDKKGKNLWVRAIYKNKEDKVVSSLWAFDLDYGSASNCASNCTSDCGSDVRDYAALRSGMFGSVAQ